LTTNTDRPISMAMTNTEPYRIAAEGGDDREQDAGGDKACLEHDRLSVGQASLPRTTPTTIAASAPMAPAITFDSRGQYGPRCRHRRWL
jgi:hypothetical protein